MGGEHPGGEHQDSCRREQPPGAGVLFGERAEAHRAVLALADAQDGGQRLRHGQSDRADQVAVPLAAEADAESEPDQIGQGEQRDGGDLAGVPVHRGGDDRGHHSQRHAPEQDQQHREPGRADGLLEGHQGARQRRPAGDGEGRGQHDQQPEQPQAERGRGLRVEAHLGVDPERAAELFDQPAAERHREGVPGRDAEQGERDQPDHRRPGGAAEQFPAARDRPEPQLAQEHLGHGQRADQAHGQRHRDDPGIDGGEEAGPAVEADRAADREGEGGGEHVREAAAGQVVRPGRPEAERGHGRHRREPGQDHRHRVQPAAHGAGCSGRPGAGRPARTGLLVHAGLPVGSVSPVRPVPAPTPATRVAQDRPARLSACRRRDPARRRATGPPAGRCCCDGRTPGAEMDPSGRSLLRRPGGPAACETEPR